MVRTKDAKEELLDAFKKCERDPNPSICRDKVLAKFLAERTISEAVVDILKTNIDEGLAIAKRFEENILPSMKEFNDNFTEFMARKEVILKSVDGTVKKLSDDIDDIKKNVAKIPGMKGDISGMKGDISGMKGDISGMKGEVDKIHGIEEKVAKIPKIEEKVAKIPGIEEKLDEILDRLP